MNTMLQDAAKGKVPIAEPRGHWLGGDVMSEAAFASLGPSSTVSHAKASSEPGYVVRPATE